MQKLIFLASLGPLLQACVITDWKSVTEAPLDRQAYVFECENDYTFTVKFVPEKAYVFQEKTHISLPKAASLEENLYSDGKTVFRFRGEQASLEMAKQHYHICQNNPTKAIWATAKLNGVDFRALGYDPEWILEIKEFNKIRFITQHGNGLYEFKTPHSVIDYQTKQISYSTHSINHTLEILLQDKPCTDTVNNIIYETTVFVGMDGLGYHGCGKALYSPDES